MHPLAWIHPQQSSSCDANNGRVTVRLIVLTSQESIPCSMTETAVGTAREGCINSNPEVQPGLHTGPVTKLVLWCLCLTGSFETLLTVRFAVCGTSHGLDSEAFRSRSDTLSHRDNVITVQGTVPKPTRQQGSSHADRLHECGQAEQASCQASSVQHLEG